jgi:hypothetical protein
MARFTLQRYDFPPPRELQDIVDEASVNGDWLIAIGLNADGGFHSVLHLHRAPPPTPHPSD